MTKSKPIFTKKAMREWGKFSYREGKITGRHLEKQRILKFIKKNKDCTIGWIIKELEK